MDKLLAIGFEIEGEFTRSFEVDLENYGQVKGDGSVVKCTTPEGVTVCRERLTEQEKNRHLEMRTGEFVTSIIPASNRRAVSHILDRFEKAYQAKEYHYNKSAGLHVHTSYSPNTPFYIISRLFYAEFIAAFKRKFPVAYNLRSKNTKYCNVNLKDGDISRYNEYGIVNSTGNRYIAMNIWPALDKHGTIEFRIFPSDKPKRMKEYIFWLMDFIEARLEKNFSIPMKTRIPIEKRMVRKDISDEVNSKKKIKKTGYAECTKDVSAARRYREVSSPQKNIINLQKLHV